MFDSSDGIDGASGNDVLDLFARVGPLGLEELVHCLKEKDVLVVGDAPQLVTHRLEGSNLHDYLVFRLEGRELAVEYVRRLPVYEGGNTASAARLTVHAENHALSIVHRLNEKDALLVGTAPQLVIHRLEGSTVHY